MLKNSEKNKTELVGQVLWCKRKWDAIGNHYNFWKENDTMTWVF